MRDAQFLGETLKLTIASTEAFTRLCAAELNTHLMHVASNSSPEQSGKLAACAAVNWWAWLLEERLGDAQKEEWPVDELLKVVTQQVSTLLSFRTWHVGLVVDCEIDGLAPDYGRNACQVLDTALQHIGQTILAPVLTRFLLTDDGIVDGRLCSLDAMPDDTGGRPAEIALAVERSSSRTQIDERYSAIAKGLAVLAEPGRPRGDFQGATAYVRGLRTEAFIHFLARLFAETFAAKESWLIDADAVSYAAMRLMNRMGDQSTISPLIRERKPKSGLSRK